MKEQKHTPGPWEIRADPCHYDSNKASEISVGGFYETMVFLSDLDDNKYHDADVSKCIPTQGRWCIDKPNCDNEANDMHEAIVAEITERMESGTI